MRSITNLSKTLYFYNSSSLSITQTLKKSNSMQTIFKTFEKSNSFGGPFRAKPIENHIR